MVTSPASVFDEKRAGAATELASVLEEHLRLVFADLFENDDILGVALSPCQRLHFYLHDRDIPHRSRIASCST